jgi:hypothetical protein
MARVEVLFCGKKVIISVFGIFFITSRGKVMRVEAMVPPTTRMNDGRSQRRFNICPAYIVYQTHDTPRNNPIKVERSIPLPPYGNELTCNAEDC